MAHFCMTVWAFSPTRGTQVCHAARASVRSRTRLPVIGRTGQRPNRKSAKGLGGGASRLFALSHSHIQMTCQGWFM